MTNPPHHADNQLTPQQQKVVDTACEKVRQVFKQDLHPSGNPKRESMTDKEWQEHENKK